MEIAMSHYHAHYLAQHDAHYGANPGLPGAPNPAPDGERLPDPVHAAADADAEQAALRRKLLLYGTAGQAGRAEVRVS
jgi:hypothetical protein